MLTLATACLAIAAAAQIMLLASVVAYQQKDSAQEIYDGVVMIEGGVKKIKNGVEDIWKKIKWF
jgi:hypothetical protein